MHLDEWEHKYVVWIHVSLIVIIYGLYYEQVYPTHI